MSVCVHLCVPLGSSGVDTRCLPAPSFLLILPPPFSTFVPFPLHLSLSTLSVSYTIGWGSSLLLYCCDKRQDQKQLTEGSQSRNRKARTEAEASHAAYWLVPQLSYTPRTTCPGMALPTVSCPLHHSVIKKIPPTTCLLASLTESSPQLKFPLPKSACAKLTEI